MESVKRSRTEFSFGKKRDGPAVYCCRRPRITWVKGKTVKANSVFVRCHGRVGDHATSSTATNPSRSGRNQIRTAHGRLTEVLKPGILPVVSGNTGTVRRPTPINQRLLRTKQAAAYLSISQWKLRRLTQDGRLPYVQDCEGAPFLFDVRDLDMYIDKNKHFGTDDLLTG